MTPKQKERARFYAELSEAVPKLVNAIKHLERITGKRCIGDIEPLNEKRWSGKCWEAYHTVVEVKEMVLLGRPWSEIEKEIMKEITPTVGWVGAVPVEGDWPKIAGSVSIKARMDKLFPKLKGKWTKTNKGVTYTPSDISGTSKK